MRLQAGRPPPQVEEVFAGHPRRGVIADREPCLGAMRLVEIVRRAGPAHARRYPARLQCVGEHAGPKRAGGSESQQHVVQLALGVSGGARPAPARPGDVVQVGEGALMHPGAEIDQPGRSLDQGGQDERGKHVGREYLGHAILGLDPPGLPIADPGVVDHRVEAAQAIDLPGDLARAPHG